ncbi:casein kinase II beta subunit [Caulochytrium protostelioides]|uniref:Casein kinase II subunit beta n=1 Tax=Caulochytrium protostelioides TaxID=1555241 RepID=A0A4P9WUV9_9FUNG|nr:casein kinase II beta subunit [Caulochytrium protostelioides]
MSAWDPSSSSSSETNSENPSWIHWYCNLRGHNFFLAVPDDFIEDDFNLTGLSGVVKYYTAALEMILDLEPSEPTSVPMPDENMIRADAELLYSLIHQRYINTKQGLFHMAHRYQAGEFGRCPRLGCGNCAVLPVGRFDQTGMDTMKLYCPRCIDIYHPPDPVYVQIDGAFFGSSFPHMLFKTFPSLPR